MAFTRAHLYTRDDQHTAYYCKAFCHPARLTILRKLKRDGPCTVEVLTRLNPLSQPTVSQHLEILRKMNLVIYHELTPYVFYSLNKAEFSRAQKSILKYFELL